MAQPRSTADMAPFGALSEAFQNFRVSSGMVRPSFPLPLRRRAIDVLRAGGALSSVASACGVAPQTLRNWAALTPPAPRRLCVASDEIQNSGEFPLADVAPEAPPEAPQEADSFEFHLACGVSLRATPKQALWLIRALGGVR